LLFRKSICRCIDELVYTLPAVDFSNFIVVSFYFSIVLGDLHVKEICVRNNSLVVIERPRSRSFDRKWCRFFLGFFILLWLC